LGGFDVAKTIGHAVGVASSVTLAVDIPSSFAVTPGYSLPAGVTLVTLSATQVRLDMDRLQLGVGTFQIKLRATAL
jgi:hypothetical protein